MRRLPLIALLAVFEIIWRPVANKGSRASTALGTIDLGPGEAQYNAT